MDEDFQGRISNEIDDGQRINRRTVAGEVVAILTADEEEELRDTGAARSEILKLTSEAQTQL